MTTATVMSTTTATATITFMSTATATTTTTATATTTTTTTTTTSMTMTRKAAMTAPAVMALRGATAAARGQLGAFAQQLAAQRGKKLPAEIADLLAAFARNALAAL